MYRKSYLRTLAAMGFFYIHNNFKYTLVEVKNILRNMCAKLLSNQTSSF